MHQSAEGGKEAGRNFLCPKNNYGEKLMDVNDWDLLFDLLGIALIILKSQIDQSFPAVQGNPLPRGLSKVLQKEPLHPQPNLNGPH